MKHLERLVSNVPIRRTYKLYITGHSLGGALATLFGFYASCCGSSGSGGDTSSSSVSSLPITIVSVASPRVGNIAFARAFVELESLGKLRHLRIANHKDPITLNPTVSAKRALALSVQSVGIFSAHGYGEWRGWRRGGLLSYGYENETTEGYLPLEREAV